MRFELEEWRKPFLADDGLVVPVGGIALLFGIGFGAIAPDVLRWSHGLAWSVAVAAVAGATAIAWIVGHPQHGPGSVAFDGGTIRTDDGRGAPFEGEFAKLKGAVIIGHRGQPEREKLALPFEGAWVGRTIRVVRLVDPLDQVVAALRLGVAQHGDLAAFDRNTASQVWQVQLVLAIGGLIALGYALMQMFGK